MDYFITDRLREPLSAIELVMINRVKLFAQADRKARIVTRDYERHVSRVLKGRGLTDRQYLNMYDFFQHVADDAAPQSNPRLQFPTATLVRADNARQENVFVEESSTAIATITYLDDALTQVDAVSHFNSLGALYQRDLYDHGNWLSLRQFFDAAGHITTQEFLTRQGTVVLTEAYGPDAAGTWANRGMKLVSKTGNTRFFTSLDVLFAYFLDQIAARDHAALFIADRHEMAVWPLSHMTVPARRVLQMHSSHTVDADDPEYSQIAYYVQMAVDHGFDAVLTATKRQRDLLAKRILLPIFAVPIRPLASLPATTKLAERPANHLIAISRLSAEKRLGDTIDAIDQVKKTHPAVQLDIYGASMAGYEEDHKLRHQVAALKLEDTVHFRGFVRDLGPVYRSAQMLIVSSKYEGFNIGLQDGLAYGVPAVSYAIEYGPKELVHDGINGRLVPNGDVAALAAAISELLDNDALRQELSTGARASVAPYLESAAIAAWAQVWTALG
ncbi:glycosyltransferase [Lacticaseibacillus camelliae]|uniref:Glycosyltransferase, group 1 family protein n=1 Tax=Lacticaseibacillus camelliae DSM 22697 = JCM 13995 TaxID=1423730 RepID=A0A0R2FMC1_9LACO|nr:glycosyltransferase [Lacticaseibacillus camelliae]KRN25932.1 glycosyltransferase, group 1 family protein [Lacticaseibacillus camelliae DSM 22697 = JCM 13995]